MVYEKNSYIMERRGKIFHDICKISHIMETTEQTTDCSMGLTLSVGPD